MTVVTASITRGLQYVVSGMPGPPLAVIELLCQIAISHITSHSQMVAMRTIESILHSK